MKCSSATSIKKRRSREKEREGDEDDCVNNRKEEGIGDKRNRWNEVIGKEGRKAECNKRYEASTFRF